MLFETVVLCSDSEQSMTFTNYSSLIFLKQNITNKYVDDAYYSEISPSDTGLMTPSVQSRETLNVYKTIKYVIFSPETCKNLYFF